MSVYVFCQALPEQSALLKRLRTDARLYRLYMELLPLGSGPFWPSELDPDEMAETLEHLARAEQRLFATPEAVRQAWEELNREIQEARALYPGIELRQCFLDKTYDEIYERLSQHLKARGEEDLLAILPMLFSGEEEAMKPPELAGAYGELGVVSAARVKEAAFVLASLPPEALFDLDTEDWLAEDYDSWRTVYLEAALRKEAILVG